jgi:N-acyl-D-aspartate/D-glutamate deacylase
MSQGLIWTISIGTLPILTISIGTLDVIGEPFCAMAIDAKSRLIISSGVFVDPAEIVAILDEAYSRSGRPDEIRIDRGFKFSSAVVMEWSKSHDVTVVWT